MFLNFEELFLCVNRNGSSMAAAAAIVLHAAPGAAAGSRRPRPCGRLQNLRVPVPKWTLRPTGPLLRRL